MKRDNVAAALENLRSTLVSRKDTTGMSITRQDLAPLHSAFDLLDCQWSEEAKSQLETHEPGKSAALIETRCEPWLLAIFYDPQSNKRPTFEYLAFENVNPDRLLHELYQSNARSIRGLQCSAGFKKENGVVAIFPEDRPSSDQNQRDKSDTLFFIDRFVDRFETFSIPALQTCVDDDSFPLLKAAFRAGPDSDLTEKLCADWMWMHEGSHRDGLLPYRSGTIPNTTHFATDSDLRSFKNSWESGAFEEMRADVLGMCKLIELQKDNSSESIARLLEFILLERLVRYPIQYLKGSSDRKIDYDSLGSHVLFSYLEKEGYLFVEQGILRLHPKWQEGLRGYREMSQSIEQQAITVADSASHAELLALQSRLLKKIEADPYLKADDRKRNLTRAKSKSIHSDQLVLRKWLGREVIEQHVQQMCRFDDQANRYTVFPFYHSCSQKIKS